MQKNASNSIYTEYNVLDCFQLYNDYWTALGNIVIVTKNDTRPIERQVSDTLLIYASIVLNSDSWTKNQWAIENGTQVSTRNRARLPSGPVATWYLGPDFYEVDSCYVQPSS
ncbi:hypothetical protein ONS95_004415 [Cadophora gregata]|uniref:uncharacterized protein n=1 Tax=Cadophora gregata TaxID=51156 RepID=UPI0026DC0A4A|nr:uncharacterized protein ONS95_004415 [Cadophora gregata]KAK0105189.1 hypothetical protein ONS96_004590 [Cadophora gregata f. sp. sojae]KAK0105902.1 hypothetical protein ONS95_004415 [Cadophora gregata]